MTAQAHINSKLQDAAGEGNIDEVIALVTKGGDLSSLDKFGEDIISASAHNGVSFVSFLLKIGADPNLRNTRGRTCLHWAVLNRKLDILALLLNNGAILDADCSDVGYTLLHECSEMAFADELRLLLSRASPKQRERQDDSGRTPLMCSVMGGSLACAKLLLDAGAVVDTESELKLGDTALTLAARSGKASFVELLIAHGANPEIKGWMGLSARDHARIKRDESPWLEGLLPRTATNSGGRASAT